MRFRLIFSIHSIHCLIPACGVLLLCAFASQIAHARTIDFAGQTWTVRTGTGGPGPNQWSDSEQSVWVDNAGLHLKIRNIEGVWHCAEITSTQSARYGIHRFYLETPIGQLDPNVVASPFLYEDDNHEVDIEFSRWQKVSGNNTQYVIQPYLFPGNIHRFETPNSASQTTHAFDWQPASIHFISIQGHNPEPGAQHPLIQEWTYTGRNIPSESGQLRLHINLWLVKGTPPTNGQEVEFIIKAADLPSTSSTPDKK